jgi:hypothetical protein
MSEPSSSRCGETIHARNLVARLIDPLPSVAVWPLAWSHETELASRQAVSQDVDDGLVHARALLDPSLVAIAHRALLKRPVSSQTPSLCSQFAQHLGNGGKAALEPDQPFSQASAGYAELDGDAMVL